jgi:hypothetical protein
MEDDMIVRKTIMAIVAAATIATGAITAPKPAEAACWGCWVGAGLVAGLIGGALISSYRYGYGYPGYYGYGYPSYYGYPARYYYGPRYYYGGRYIPRYSYRGYYAPRPYFAPRIRYAGYRAVRYYH